MTGSQASFLIDCQFYLALNHLLDLLGVFNDQKVIMPMDLMQKYDWSRMDAKLVYSTPEYVRSGDENASGIAMLSRIIQKYFKESFQQPQSISIEYQVITKSIKKKGMICFKGSSLGAIKREWLKDFEDSVKGCLGRIQHTSSNGIKISFKRRYNDEDDSDDKGIIDLTKEEEESVKFKVVFPTKRTVMNSSVGPGDFGTLFCKRKDYESADCPREIFHDCVTKPRGGPCGYSMHSKIMTVSSGERDIYYYCGSHNFTSSAWGKRVGGAKSMFQVTNFEVGVILESGGGVEIEYPYYRPVPKYSEDDTPWDQTEI